MLKRLWLIAALLCFTAFAAFAELSPNPWLEVNDEEDLKAVYAKSQKRNNTNMAGYASEEETLIDRSHAYVELPKDDEEDSGFLGKISGSLKKKEDAPLITKAAAKRRAAAAKSAKREESSNNSGGDMLSGLGLSKMKKSLIPSFNTNNLIQKFERASGINFKSIGKSLRR